jgi:cytochrome c oxidase subunit 2
MAGNRLRRDARRGRRAAPRRSLVVRLGLVMALVAVTAGCSETLPLDTLNPQGEASQLIANLINPVFAVALVILLIVNLGVVYIAIRFRRRKGEDNVFPEQIHGNTKLELSWTIAPAVILAIIAVFTLVTLFKLYDVPSDSAMTVRVEGQQWWWSFKYDVNGNGTYDDQEDITTATELVIPAGKTIALHITSNDVIHSFWIPALNGKKDAVPGRIHDWWLEAEKPGYYLGQCTEFCGLSHGYMRMAVKALSEADFASWMADQKKPAAVPTDEAAKRGLETWISQCSSCHQIGGVNGHDCKPLPENATVEEYDPEVNCYPGVSQGWNGAAQVSGTAPNLTHLMSRTRFIGGLYDLYLDDGTTPAVNTIASWIRDPEDFKPMAPTPAGGNTYGRGMPTLPLTEAQIGDLVAYLITLK